MSQLTFQTWESWMRSIALASANSAFDGSTGLQDVQMEFRHPSDPSCFHGFLGEQIRSCVFRPSPVFVENFLVGLGDETIEPDPETFEIANICEAEEGMDSVLVGYSFRLRFRWLDRLADLF